MGKPPRGQSHALLCSRPGEAGFAKPIAKLTGFSKNYHQGTHFCRLANVKVGLIANYLNFKEMKLKKNIFIKTVSYLLAVIIFFTSTISFTRCKENELRNEKTQVINVLDNYQLSLNDEILCNLQNAIYSIDERNELKSGVFNKIESTFGKIDWYDNQFVLYENGKKGIFVPIKKENKIEAFILASPENNFSSVIMKINVTPGLDDKFLSGSIHFFNLECTEICSYSYKNGKYLSSNTYSLKSVPVGTENCNFTCISNCLGGVMNSNWLYEYTCGLACAGWETGVGLFVCIFCIGGPALYCIDQCCPNIVE